MLFTQHMLLYMSPSKASCKQRSAVNLPRRLSGFFRPLLDLESAHRAHNGPNVQSPLDYLESFHPKCAYASVFYEEYRFLLQKQILC